MKKWNYKEVNPSPSLHFFILGMKTSWGVVSSNDWFQVAPLFLFDLQVLTHRQPRVCMLTYEWHSTCLLMCMWEHVAWTCFTRDAHCSLMTRWVSQTTWYKMRQRWTELDTEYMQLNTEAKRRKAGDNGSLFLVDVADA